MGTYQIDWEKSALRELRHLDRKVVPRIVDAVDSLSANRFQLVSANCKGACGPIAFV